METVIPESVELTHDGMRLLIKMPLLEEKVYEIGLENFTSRKGEPLTNPLGWYTLNKLKLPQLIQ